MNRKQFKLIKKGENYNPLDDLITLLSEVYQDGEYDDEKPGEDEEPRTVYMEFKSLIIDMGKDIDYYDNFNVVTDRDFTIHIGDIFYYVGIDCCDKGIHTNHYIKNVTNILNILDKFFEKYSFVKSSEFMDEVLYGGVVPDIDYAKAESQPYHIKIFIFIKNLEMVYLYYKKMKEFSEEIIQMALTYMYFQ